MLINDIETLKAMIPTVTGSSFEKYRHSLALAQEWFASEIAGRPLMDEILRMEDEPSNTLLLLAKSVVAYKGYMDAIPQLDVLETNNGFAVVNDDALAPASRERVAALIRSMQSNLDAAVGQLLCLLEDSPQYHASWSQSPAFSIMYESYLPTLRMFRRYGTFAGTQFDFIAALPSIRGIITQKIEPVISAEYSGYLLEKSRNKQLSATDIPMLEELRYALAAFYNNSPDTAAAHLLRVRRRLEANPQTYPAFAASELYALINSPRADNQYPSIYTMI